MTEYLYPTTVQEAIEMLESRPGQALVLAGGTDVLPDIRKGKKQPACLVDITRIPELGQIVVRDGMLEVGAAVTFATLKSHPFVCQQVHALAAAAGSVGAIGIQTAATWAGNIVQAMPAADGAVVALALQAKARLVDRDGAAWRSVEELFLGPGKSAVDPTRQIITHLRFPVPAGQWGTAWERIGRRASLALPILNCAVTVVIAAGRIERATVALGPVAPRPFRARAAERFLAGKEPTAEAVTEAGRLAQSESNPRTSVMRASREYRLAIIPVLVRDALTQAIQRASE